MRDAGLPLAIAVLGIVAVAAGFVRTLRMELQRLVDDGGDRRTGRIG